MREEKTQQYNLYYPADINPKIVELFHRAIKLVNTLTDLKHKKATITFVRNNKFTVDLVIRDRLAEYWRDMIVYNLDKIEQKDELSLSIILLEELVHCYCDTLDEKITGLIVASLIPDIIFDILSMSYKKAGKTI